MAILPGEPELAGSHLTLPLHNPFNTIPPCPSQTGEVEGKYIL